MGRPRKNTKKKSVNLTFSAGFKEETESYFANSKESLSEMAERLVRAEIASNPIKSTANPLHGAFDLKAVKLHPASPSRQLRRAK